MKKNTISILILLFIVGIISCTIDSSNSTDKKIIGIGNFAFAEMKGSFQLYTEDSNENSIYGNATYISDIGVSTEVDLFGTVNPDGTFSITENTARGITGLTTDITIGGGLSTGQYIVTTIKDENNIIGALTFDLDSTSVVVNSKGYEAWEMDLSDLYKDHSDGSSGPEPIEGVTATFVQNFSSVMTLSPLNGIITNITVYNNGDGTYDYVKQIGDYDVSTRIITMIDADRYSAPEMDEGVDADGDGIADCFISTFTLAQPMRAIISEDGSTMNMDNFWTGWSWNYSEGTVIYTNY